MTVREIIQMLSEYEMGTQVVITAENVLEYDGDYPEFNKFDIQSGIGSVEINIRNNGVTYVDQKRLFEKQNEINELKEEISELRNINKKKNHLDAN